MKHVHNLLLIVTLLTGAAACSSTPIANQNPVGQLFPTVSGTSLEKQNVILPDLFKGEKTVVLLGYKQNSQFDIDRWLIGLDMTGTEVKAYELPTIKGLAPQFFKGYIDEGMRSGIPKELWGGVITIYGDGARVQAFTGNTNPLNARVMLLDEESRIVFFHDRGFSVGALNALRAELHSG